MRLLRAVCGVLVVSVCGVGVHPPPLAVVSEEEATPAVPESAAVRASYARLPLRFEQNAGQLEDAVKVSAAVTSPPANKTCGSSHRSMPTAIAP